jgi:hypothetical protein
MVMLAEIAHMIETVLVEIVQAVELWLDKNIRFLGNVLVIISLKKGAKKCGIF